MLTITKSSDPIEVQSVISLIYGQPGSGKTSIAGTSDRCLLLDFDRGAHRSAFRPDTVRVDNWKQVANLTKSDLEGYKTVGVDTVGRAIDFIIADMPSADGKTLLKRASGEPSLQGYGMLKSIFTGWLKRLTTMGIDVVLIAHDREKEDGDSRIIRPDVTGGSYAEIVKVADFVGYLFKEGDRTVLDFNPRASYIGKNSAGLPPLEVPNFATDKAWFAGIVTKMKEAIGGLADTQREAMSLIEGLVDKIKEAKTPADFAALKESMSDWPKPTQLHGWGLLRKEAKKVGVIYDAKAKAFVVEPETEAA